MRLKNELRNVELSGCIVRYDLARGVVYVDSPEGKTLIRICRLPEPPALPPKASLDVTNGVGSAWSEDAVG